MDVEELEAHMLCPTDVTGIVYVLAKNARDQEGHRRFVIVKKMEGTVVADVRQNAIMRARMESEYQKLQVIIEHINMKQGGLATMEREEKSMSGGLEDLRKINILDDTISAEEVELLEKRMEMEELLKERRRTKVEEWRASDVVRSDVAQKGVPELKAPRRRSVYLTVLRVDVDWMGHVGETKFHEQGQTFAEKRNAVIRKESGKTRDNVSCQDIEVGNAKSLDEMGFDLGAGSKASSGQALVRQESQRKASSSMILQPS